MSLDVVNFEGGTRLCGIKRENGKNELSLFLSLSPTYPFSLQLNCSISNRALNRLVGVMHCESVEELCSCDETTEYPIEIVAKDQLVFTFLVDGIINGLENWNASMFTLLTISEISEPVRGIVVLVLKNKDENVSCTLTASHEELKDVVTAFDKVSIYDLAKKQLIMTPDKKLVCQIHISISDMEVEAKTLDNPSN